MALARAAKAIAPSAPVVVVTGWAQREEVERARGREVASVLLKPIDPEAMAGSLATRCGTRSCPGAPILDTSRPGQYQWEVDSPVNR